MEDAQERGINTLKISEYLRQIYQKKTRFGGRIFEKAR
jgi:hypothetical protein